MQWHPVVLEARLRQLTALRQPAESAALGAASGQLLAALRAFDSMPEASARLVRSASRFARRLIEGRGDGTAIEQDVLRLGIEMGRPLDPLEVAAVVRAVRDGSALAPVADGPGDDEPAARTKLFTQLALVATLARARTP